jgi:hypothetical protein
MHFFKSCLGVTLALAMIPIIFIVFGSIAVSLATALMPG